MSSLTSSAEPRGRTDAAAPLCITMGDPCGIGPEIIVDAFLAERPSDVVVAGDVGVMRRTCAWLGAARQRAMPPIAVIERPEDLPEVPAGAMPVIQALAPQADADALSSLAMGSVDARAAAAAAACIAAAAGWAMEGRVRAVVTAPIHKEALAAAGIDHPGHTEMLAAIAGRGGPPADVRMMLANEQLRTVLVTVHMALRDAIDAISIDAVLGTIRIAHRSAAAWGQPRPRIAVAGLNPHAGEGGRFGSEERELIAPAVAAARSEGIDASGPHAPDTVFMRARNAPGHPGEFDIVVAMYHDQGLIPVKYLGVDEGVNVTLGLPFVRTSPDHGTAFDIAGQGTASSSSLRAALRMARRLAAREAG